MELSDKNIKINKIEEDGSQKLVWDFFFEEVRLDTQIALLVIPIIMLLELITTPFIVYGVDSPAWQVVPLLVAYLTVLLFLCFQLPYKTKIENILSIINSVFYFLNLGFMLFLATKKGKDMVEKDKYNYFGNLIIAFIALALLTNAIIGLAPLYQGVREFYKNRKKKVEKSSLEGADDDFVPFDKVGGGFGVRRGKPAQMVSKRKIIGAELKGNNTLALNLRFNQRETLQKKKSSDFENFIKNEKRVLEEGNHDSRTTKTTPLIKDKEVAKEGHPGLQDQEKEVEILRSVQSGLNKPKIEGSDWTLDFNSEQKQPKQVPVTGKDFESLPQGNEGIFVNTPKFRKTKTFMKSKFKTNGLRPSIRKMPQVQSIPINYQSQGKNKNQQLDETGPQGGANHGPEKNSSDLKVESKEDSWNLDIVDLAE